VFLFCLPTTGPTNDLLMEMDCDRRSWKFTDKNALYFSLLVDGYGPTWTAVEFDPTDAPSAMSRLSRQRRPRVGANPGHRR